MGPRVAEIAQRLGKPFMPHQRHMADVALEIDPETGRFAYSEVVIIGPRQVTGKTEFLLPLMTHRCVGFASFAGPQRVLYTAQTADEARLKWRDVHLARLRRARTIRGMFTPRLTQNKEALIWRDGSMWIPGSTTGKTGGTGDTLDLGVIDEAWSRPDFRTELGMRPTMLTRPWAQLLVCSMIPGLSRAAPGTWPYLKEKRRLGRLRVEAGVTRGTALFDFSAPDGLDPGDPATWRTCMPAVVAGTVSEQKIRDDFDSDLPLVDFCAEYLGWEPVDKVPKWTLVPRAVWVERFDAGSAVVGTSALGVEISEDRQRGWVGAAGYRADGQYHVEVVEPGFKILPTVAGIDWMERRIVDIVEDNDICTVVIDPRRPAASLIVPLRNRGIEVLTPAQPDIAGACGRFYDAIVGPEQDEDEVDDEPAVDDGLRLFHIGQEVLDRALAQTRRFELGVGSFVFVRKGQSGEVGPVYCTTLALHGLVVMGSEPDYDLLDSVDASRPCRCSRYIYPRGGVWLHAHDGSPACRQD